MRRPHPIRALKGKGKTIGKVLLCLLVFVLLCVPPVFVNTAVGYVPVFFFVFVLIFSFVYSRILKRALVFDQICDHVAIERGGNATVFMRIKNSSPLFVSKAHAVFTIRDLFGESAKTERFEFSISPLQMEDFTFDLSFNHLGEFSVGLEEFTVSDPLGLFNASFAAGQEQSIMVVPKLFDVNDMTLSDTSVQQVSDALRPSKVSGSDYSTVRDYVPGDPIKTIHWKLSARSKNYMTKVFEDHSNPQLDIYLDTCAPAYDSEDLMSIYDASIETALSLEAFAHNSGLDTRVIFLNNLGETDQFLVTSDTDYRDLMAALPKITPSEGAFDFHQMMRKLGTSTQGADNVAVCSAYIDPELIESLVHIHATQRNVLMYGFLPSSEEEDARKKTLGHLRTLSGSNIPWVAMDATTGELQ